ncbi:MAG: glycosyltransferase family 4 protein [Candidatus Zixiibacteriota bacterium]
MKILIVTQHFPPEKGAVRRLFEFARYFVKEGQDVTVLTGIPNYPDGVVPEKYRGHWFYTEEIDGVKVYRSYVLPASNRNPGKRMLGFVIFLFTALINSFRLNGRYDVVIASTPPVTTTVMGWLLSKFKRAKFFIEIRDLQPESGWEFGNLRPGLFTRVIQKVVHSMYRRADRIVSVTDGITSYLVSELKIPREKVVTIKSGVSNEFIDSGANGIRKTYGWENKYLIVYAGTLGYAHSLETVVEAARNLTDQPDIFFVFVGDGQKRSVLEGMVRDYGLKNVTFLGSQPLESIPFYLQTGDVLIESLKDVPLTKGTFPSKLFEYMASGRPILFGSDDGEAVRELEKAGGALSFSSQDVETLCDLIMKLKTGQIDGGDLGSKYRHHAVTHHRRELWAKRYLNAVRDMQPTP